MKKRKRTDGYYQAAELVASTETINRTLYAEEPVLVYERLDSKPKIKISKVQSKHIDKYSTAFISTRLRWDKIANLFFRAITGDEEERARVRAFLKKRRYTRKRLEKLKNNKASRVSEALVA